MWSNDYSSGLPSKPERANVDLPRDTDGNTYLHELCRKDAPPQVIREAIEKLGANVNALNKKNIPPLGIAIQYARAETVACLIDLGAELCFPVNKTASFNAVWLAAARGRDEALKTILDRGGGRHVNSPGIDSDGFESQWPALHIAVKNSNSGLIAPLAKAGALLNEEANSDRATPLFLAIANNSEKQVRLLLDAGADLERCQSDTGRAPLAYASYHKEPGAAKTLLAFGANPDATDNSGMTPLMYAAENGDYTTAETLVAAGARVDMRRGGSNGETALMIAARKGSPDVLRVLLKAGADPMLADTFNKTAAQYADGWSARNTLDEAEATAMRRQFEDSYRKYRP